jgi:hypothetical protein
MFRSFPIGGGGLRVTCGAVQEDMPPASLEGEWAATGIQLLLTCVVD